jgi:hypothetical protein
VTPYERLLLEAIPDGTFGGARPPRPDPPETTARTRHRTTAIEQAMNRARLEAALDEKPGRHLRAVPPAA